MFIQKISIDVLMALKIINISIRSIRNLNIIYFKTIKLELNPKSVFWNVSMKIVKH